MSVGVGTGGRSAGNEIRGAVPAEDCATVGTLTLVGDVLGPAEPAADVASAGVQSATRRGVGDVARVGAAPMPPAPTGALIGAGAAPGPANCQPTVTAKGRPRATRPRKIDLGESRTHEHRFTG